MKIASISIADYCECTEGMPHDVERLYFRMILKMLSREGGLPDDDRDNARVFGYDIRVYKGLKAKLLKWSDTISVKDGLLVNERVEKDLADYRSKRKSAGDRSNISRTSGEDRSNIEPKSSHISHATICEINDIAKPTPTPTPTPLSEVKNNSPPANTGSVAAGGHDEIFGLNGSTRLIVESLAGWLSPYAPDFEFAHRSIAEAVQIFGADAVRDGFADLKAEHADGKVRALNVKAFYGFVRQAKAKQSAPRISSGMDYRSAKQAAARAELDRVRKIIERDRAGKTMEVIQ